MLTDKKTARNHQITEISFMASTQHNPLFLNTNERIINEQ